MAKFIEKKYAIQCAADVAQDMRNDGLIAEASGADAVCDWLKDIPDADVVPASDFRDCRNELCLKCGAYTQKHNGACDGCRWR